MFKIVDLGFNFNDLEPYIDSLTMELHYTKHYFTYTDNLNKSIIKYNVTCSSIEDLLSKCISHSSIRNNAGGFFNHNLFWKIINPSDKIDISRTLIYKLIIQNFGSFENFLHDFNLLSLSHFGSGWAWLCYNKNNKLLNILSTPNQDNPLMYELGFNKELEPLLCLDIWEHAYYLQYQNRKVDYIKSFWKVLNWRIVDNIYTSLL
jgi:Fe-Mn family superoxide dismutase